ncbi:MAG: DNA polymerase I [Alphaproteobacteria bacterium]|jgi:DNA polymerase-1|nr:DNA polymerase I [Candidatus Jidaibacter sp.]
MKLILIDGYGFVFRAFHSLPPLSRADGTPIGAVYGFSNMLLRILGKYPNDAIAVVVDSGSKNFRHEIYPNYKANRPEPPTELIAQFPLIRESVDAFGIKCIEKPGFEADDLIATYAIEAKNKGLDVIIVSSDKDLMQLTEYGIEMYDAMKDKYIEADDILKKFGVTAEKIKDVQALIGDSSDNIPGVKGIGVKTASELINQYGSLSNLYENLDKISQEKRKNMLLEGKESAMISYELVALKKDAPIDYNIDELLISGINYPKLAAYFKEQGFKGLLSRVESHLESNVKDEVSFVELSDVSKLKEMIPDIYKAAILCMYKTESDLYLSFGKRHIKLAVSKQQQQQNFFEEDSEGNSIADALKVLDDILKSDSVAKVTADAKSWYKLSPHYKVIHDVETMSYTLETGRPDCSFASLVSEHCAGYQGNDSYALQVLYNALCQKIVSEKDVSLYERIDRDISNVIATMEENGVLIDERYLGELSELFSKQAASLESRIFAVAGSQFNIGSPKQMGSILFDILKLPAPKKSKAGSYSTSAEVLENLHEAGHEIASLILEWRQYTKLLSTYTNALPKSINRRTGRVHSTFLLTSTSTGRFSSTEPNLQNIPIRSEEGQKIRKAFIAKKKYKIISADYSQIELRLLAHYANIDTLKDAFRHGGDIHTITASEIFHVPLNEVGPDLRRKAKTINFGIIYGISAFGLAKRLGLEVGVAKQFIDRYFEKYPGIKQYMNNIVEFAKTHGYIKTIFGRKCLISGINNPNFALRGFAERAAINAPLQASAADIIKKAMVELPQDLRKRLILQVHDELLFEVEEDKVEHYSKIIKNTMENVIKLSVPLTVEVSSGDNWDQAH